MLDKTQNHLMALAIVLLTVWACSANTLVQAFEGEWRYTELVEDKASSPNCRLFHITTRQYSLKSQLDGRLAGNYFRENRPLWLGPANDCPSEVGPANPGKLYRTDLWFVLEIGRNGNHLSIRGEYDTCVGACTNGAHVLPQFQALLRQQNGMLIDILEDSNQQLIFISESTAVVAEQDASDRMFKLLEPLYEGECTRFYENNMDPIVRANTPKTEFCRAAQRLRELMPPILYHSPLTATYFTVGEFGHLGDGTLRQVWGGLDVLVEQVFIVTPDGGNVPVAAVLRKQSDGTWKVLVPIP